MMDPVFVVYTDWGTTKDAPLAAFTTKERAALWIYEQNAWWKDHAKIVEFIPDAPKEDAGK